MSNNQPRMKRPFKEKKRETYLESIESVLERRGYGAEHFTGLIVYVDDMLILGNSQAEVQRVKD